METLFKNMENTNFRGVTVRWGDVHIDKKQLEYMFHWSLLHVLLKYTSPVYMTIGRGVEGVADGVEAPQYSDTTCT